MKPYTRQWLLRNATEGLELLAVLSKRVTGKRVHDLRVSFKKIRALYPALETNQGFQEHCPVMAHCFRLAGKLRKLQVIRLKLAALPAWDAGGKESQLLDKAISKKARQLKDLIGNDSGMATLTSEIWGLGHGSLKKKLLRVSTKTSTTVLQKTAAPDVSSWHAWRTNLKRSLYLKESTGPVPKNTQAETQALPHEIGEWHDWMQVLAWLMKQKEKLHPASYSLLKQQSNMEVEKLTSLILREQ